MPAQPTIIGLVIACLAWLVVTRISFAPRWLFFRLAVLVTLLLWPPDLYLLDLGQPGQAVAVLRVGPAAAPDRYAERRR